MNKRQLKSVSLIIIGIVFLCVSLTFTNTDNDKLIVTSIIAVIVGLCDIIITHAKLGKLSKKLLGSILLIIFGIVWLWMVFTFPSTRLYRDFGSSIKAILAIILGVCVIINELLKNKESNK